MHIVTSLDFGGVEKHMENIASAYNDSNFKHSFIAIGLGGSSEVKLRELGFEVICLGQQAKIPSYSAVLSLFKLFKRESVTVVHTHGAEANFHGLIAAWLAGVPVRIGEEIGIPTHSRLAKIIFALAFKFSDRVIGVADAVVKWLYESGEVRKDKLIRIYNPIPVRSDVQHEDKLENSFTVIFVGRLEPVKNPLSLIYAVNQLKERGVLLSVCIVGDGSQRKLLEEEVARLGLDTSVSILGYKDDPSIYIRKSNVFIQPSYSEGLSLALIEAMGCGVPVIATPVGGAPEVIEQGVTGWLLKDSTSESVADALETAYLYGTDSLSLMGEKAHIAVKTRFNPNLYLKAVHDLYSSVLRDKRR